MQIRSLAAVLPSLVLACLAAIAHGAEPVEVTITDKVLVTQTKRLGINTGGDNYYNSAMRKVRAAANFEGVRYRMCTWGPVMDETGLYVYFSPSKDREAWQAMKGKVRYTILGGPNKGKQGVIKDIRVQDTILHNGKKGRYCYIEFDQPMTPHKEHQIGVMLELDRLDQGSIREKSNPEFWNTPGNTAHIGDVPPGSFGQAALWLKAGEGSSRYAFGLSFGRMLAAGDTQWKVSLWAKAKTGSPTLTVHVGEQHRQVPLTDEWVHHDLEITLPGTSPNDNIAGVVKAEGGDVLIDDIEFILDEPSRNPTPFRDILIDPLKKLNPGILRVLQTGGSDLAGILRPRLQQVGWSRDFRNLLRGGRNTAYFYGSSLHDFYVLCEYVGADPWYCLPGTIHPEEVNLFMEYLGGSADTVGGKIRADLGHPQPWTEVFEHIYVEIGNEAWNPAGYATGSYNGPGHWSDIFAKVKASPYYSTKVRCIAGGQSGAPHITRRALENAPNADLACIAPDMIHKLKKTDIEPLDTDEKLFKWIFAFADWRVNEADGEVRMNFEYATAADAELCIYEHNYHITKPSAKKDGAPIELRNRIIASLGGGVNLIKSFAAHAAGLRCPLPVPLHPEPEAVPGRSQALGLHGGPEHPGPALPAQLPGHGTRQQGYRRRPRGNPAQRRRTGIHGLFGTSLGARWAQKPEFSDYGPLPTLRSYAFKDGKTRGLILVNLDTKDPHDVKVNFPGTVKDKAARAVAPGRRQYCSQQRIRNRASRR